MPTKKEVLKVKLSYGKPVLLRVQDLNEFQGDLKDLSEEGSDQLTGEIKETGFSFAPHAWLNPKDKKWMLVDGHQRIKVLRKLAKAGYQIPKIPTIPVIAKTYKEAKRRVLQGISQYGHVKPDGLHEFLTEADILIDDVIASFDIPEVNLKSFKTEFFGKKEKAEQKEKERDENPSKIVHTCPECGHEFS